MTHFRNHANGTSLRNWLINEFLLGPTGLGDPNIDGFYIDDAWCGHVAGLWRGADAIHAMRRWPYQQPVQSWEPPQGFCDHSPIGGATEEDYYCTQDMGRCLYILMHAFTALQGCHTRTPSSCPSTGTRPWRMRVWPLSHTAAGRGAGNHHS